MWSACFHYALWPSSTPLSGTPRPVVLFGPVWCQLLLPIDWFINWGFTSHRWEKIHVNHLQRLYFYFFIFFTQVQPHNNNSSKLTNNNKLTLAYCSVAGLSLTSNCWMVRCMSLSSCSWNNFFTVPKAPITIGITQVFVVHMRWTSISRSAYFDNFLCFFL